jgi:hypothetical protein
LPEPLASSTTAQRELEQMLLGSEDAIDLVMANWLIVADIQQFQNMSRETYLAEMDSMVEHVRQAMVEMERGAAPGSKPSAPAVRCGRFCNAIIPLRFAYREEFRQEHLTAAQLQGLYRDANNLFLAGLLRTGRGSCVSMPLVYLVIGQRLGMPVYLVTVGKHYFIRWEEPGFRMNIEPTIVERVAVTPDDEVYLESEGMTQSQVRGNQLRNLTRREVIGSLLFTRAAYWASQGPQWKARQCRDLSRARQLAPEDPAIEATFEAVLGSGGTNPRQYTVEIKPKG